MQVTETLNSGLKREIKVTVPAGDMEARLMQRLSDAKDKVRINGFRPGKVPVQHLRKLYGKSFMAEVVNEILNNTTRDILSERGEKAAMQPEIVMTEDEKEAEKILAGGVDFEFQLAYEVIPPIEIKDFTGVPFGEKGMEDPHIASRVDGPRPVRHGIRLLAADLAIHGMELAVDVGEADLIQVHQCQVADAGASQRLHRPRADATDADHGDPGFQETLQRRLPIEPGNAAEPVVGIWLRHAGKMSRNPPESRKKSTATPRVWNGKRIAKPADNGQNPVCTIFISTSAERCLRPSFGRSSVTMACGRSMWISTLSTIP